MERVLPAALLGIIVFAGAVALACGTAAPVSEPPPPRPAVQDLQTRLANTGDHNKRVIDEDVVVWYVPCEPSPATWVAPIIVYHVPSESAVYLNNDGSVKTSPRPRYKSPAAQERLEAVLADDSVMRSVVSRPECPSGSTASRPPPAPPAVQDLQTRLANTGDHNKRVIDEDVVVWYIPCEPSPATWVAPIIVYHVPSESAVYLNRDGTVRASPRAHYGTTEAQERLEAVLADGDLMELVVTRPECPPGSTGSSTAILSSVELYDPSSGTFAPTGQMLEARHNHTATLLPDGRVLVVGGNERGKTLASAEIYDADTGTFSSAGTMGTPRRNHTATLLPNGTVLIVGGYDPGPNTAGLLGSAELYDPSNGSFSPAGSMQVPRRFHSATLLPNGDVLIVGGRGETGRLASAEVYDPETGTFSATGSMSTGLGKHTATLLANGDVLVFGDADIEGESGLAELYDPEKGEFASTGGPGDRRRRHTATLLGDGEVLVVGGYRAVGVYLASAERYDPAQRRLLGLVSAEGFSPAGTLGGARESHSATLLQDGRVLVVGGIRPGGTLTAAELYDPSTETFAPTGELTAGRKEHTATLLPSGQVLVVGGFSKSP